MTREQKIIEVAVRTIKNLRKNIQIADLYEDYNNGIITKEEFKTKATKLAIEPRNITDEQVIEEYNCLAELTGEILPFDEWGELLELDGLLWLSKFIKSNNPDRDYKTAPIDEILRKG